MVYYRHKEKGGTQRLTMTEFISRNHGHSCYEIIIKTTNYEHYKATEDFARRLIGHAKPVPDNNVTLKKCPFCGGKARYIYSMPLNYVECTKCKALGATIVDAYEQRDGKKKR